MSPSTDHAREDARLLERFRQGDRLAFDEIVRRHRRSIYLVARRLLGSHVEADEAAQVTFLRAWRGLGEFRGESSLRTWLTRIALTVARSLHQAQRPEASLEDCRQLLDPAAAGDALLCRSQAQQRVRQAVRTLPPRQQEVVVLKVFSEMSYRQVAETLQISEGTVKAHLHQAIANLRRSMAVAEVKAHGL